MPYTMRSLRQTDCQKIAAIANQFGYNTWTEALFCACLRKHYHNWVLTNDASEVIGFLIALCVKDECQLINLGVEASHQREGCATELLHVLQAYVLSKTITTILLEVRVSNHAAIALYHANGFFTVSKRQAYYRDGEDALIMQWHRKEEI